MPSNANILFISHGGGPLPLLGDPGHNELVTQLRSLAARLRRPEAILVISAHWEAACPTVTTSSAPSLIYDYSGFPPESYEIQYPCPGSVELAQAIQNALTDAGIHAEADATRGIDHGVFVPLKLMYPEADIPVVQLSLVSSLDPAIHLAIGKALRRLDDRNLLIIGSGFSFHNMPAFFRSADAATRDANQAFDQWLIETCGDGELSESQRHQRLLNWSRAPQARFCHPREEHLLPLHVCCAAAGRPADEIMPITVLGKSAVSFAWLY